VQPTNSPPPVTPTPPPPPRPGIAQRSLRTLLHALVILVVMQAIAPAIGDRPLPALLLAYARPGLFVPFSIGLAGGLNADRIILITLGVVIVLTNWPGNILPFAIASIFGMVLGGGIRGLIIQEYMNG
jgi:hypothetical protein